MKNLKRKNGENGALEKNIRQAPAVPASPIRQPDIANLRVSASSRLSRVYRIVYCGPNESRACWWQSSLTYQGNNRLSLFGVLQPIEPRLEAERVGVNNTY